MIKQSQSINQYPGIPYQKGDKIFINTRSNTDLQLGTWNFPTGIDATLPYTIGSVMPNERLGVRDRYSDYANKPHIILQENEFSWYRIHVDDIAYESKFENPYDNLPPIFADIPKHTLASHGAHSANYALYKSDKKDPPVGSRRWNWIKENLVVYADYDFYEDDYDEYEEDYDFNNYDLHVGQVLVENIVEDDPDGHRKVKTKRIGNIFYNGACWGEVLETWSHIRRLNGVHPDRIYIFHKHEYWNQTPYQGRGVFEKAPSLTLKEIKTYYEICKKGKALPSYFKMPVKDRDGNLHMELKLDRVSKEQLFFYLCTIRNIGEHPGLVRLTNYYYSKGLDPLFSYVLAHASLPGFNGGHSIVVDTELLQNEWSIKESPLPDIKKCQKATLAWHKLLTQAPQGYAKSLHNSGMEFIDYSWRLNDTITDLRDMIEIDKEYTFTEFKPAIITKEVLTDEK
jgi:hypothetical protein